MPLRQSRERFRMDPRLREDDNQKRKETSKQENVWEGVEYFCLEKAASRQTRTVLKFVSIIEPHRPLPSFSRTRESIYSRAPSNALAQVLTAENIYKRRNSVPHYRHSRVRGNPFTRADRAKRWDKYSQRKTSTNAETASPIIVILAYAGIHLPARTEHGVGISTHSGKHLQTQKQRPPLSSFSRTRESIYPRGPSMALGQVLTATNIPNAERAQ